MKYPETFVKKCKKVYPTWKELHEKVEEGSVWVGRYLCDSLGLSVDENDIISLFRNKKQDKVLRAAERARDKRNLYIEWCRLHDMEVEKNAAKHGYEL